MVEAQAHRCSIKRMVKLKAFLFKVVMTSFIIQIKNVWNPIDLVTLT